MIRVKHTLFIALLGLLVVLAVFIGCDNTNLKIAASPADPNDIKKTKFEGEWIKDGQKLIFTGDMWVRQAITSGSFKNSAKGSFKFNDTLMRLIADYTWNTATNAWVEYPLTQPILVIDCGYTLEGTTLTVRNAATDELLNGTWILYD